MKKRIFLTAIATIALTGCSTANYQAVPVNAGENQKISYDRGVPIVTSTKANSEVGLQFSQYADARLLFRANLKNLSPNDIDVGITNVSVKDYKGLEIRPLTADQLVEEAKSSATSQKVGVGIGVALGILGALAASQKTTNGSYEDSKGRRRNYSSTTTDPAVALAGSAVSIGAGAYGFREINRARDSKIDAVKEYYLQTTTLSPQSKTDGIFEIPLPVDQKFPQNISIIFHLAGDNHAFEYKVNKEQ